MATIYFDFHPERLIFDTSAAMDAIFAVNQP